MRVFRGWAVVAGSAVGIGFSAQIFIATGYTILAAGIAAAFGWELTDLAPGATFFLIGQVVGFPLAGVIIDRWGTLRGALAGVALFALHLIVLGRITSRWQLYAVMLSTLFMVAGLAVYAVVTNTVHILSHTASLDTAQVAKVQAIGGISVLAGRLIGGAPLDRLSDRWIGVVMTLFIATGVSGYAVADGLLVAIASSAMIGFATGGEGDVLPYMAAKYFGTRAFGKIYGGMGAMFGVGTALGPVTHTWLAASTGSVRRALLILAAMTAVASVNFLFVGRRGLCGVEREGELATATVEPA